MSAGSPTPAPHAHPAPTLTQVDDVPKEPKQGGGGGGKKAGGRGGGGGGGGRRREDAGEYEEEEIKCLAFKADGTRCGRPLQASMAKEASRPQRPPRRHG